MTTTQKTAIYAAVARFAGKDAGHICYGRTKDETRAKAHRLTSMSVIVRREMASAASIAALVHVGKL